LGSPTASPPDKGQEPTKLLTLSSTAIVNSHRESIKPENPHYCATYSLNAIVGIFRKGVTPVEWKFIVLIVTIGSRGLGIADLL